MKCLPCSLDYRHYNRVFRTVVILVPVPELVRRAAAPHFNSWLLNQASP